MEGTKNWKCLRAQRSKSMGTMSAEQIDEDPSLFIIDATGVSDITLVHPPLVDISDESNCSDVQELDQSSSSSASIISVICKDDRIDPSECVTLHCSSDEETVISSEMPKRGTADRGNKKENTIPNCVKTQSVPKKMKKRLKKKQLAKAKNGQTSSKKRNNRRTAHKRKRSIVILDSESEISSANSSVLDSSVITISDGEDVDVSEGPGTLSVLDDTTSTTVCHPPTPKRMRRINAVMLKNPKSRTLRPIVIDGSNVAFGHGQNSGIFSSRGIHICIQYFLRRGHTQVHAFVPQYRRRNPATSDHHILDALESAGHLVYTPSRRVNGKLIVSYDDRFIIEYAHKCGGIVVSRDNYSDLLNENASWKTVISDRLLMFTWVGDTIMFPQDPLGRNGPNLDEFLCF